jgi:hypothetical protein
MKDLKKRTGSGLTAPAAQTTKKRPTKSGGGHSPGVAARIARGHGEGLVGTNHVPSKGEANRVGRTGSQSKGKGGY